MTMWVGVVDMVCCYTTSVLYLMVHKILIPSPSPHLLRTCWLKDTCFNRFPSESSGQIFCVYAVKSGWILNHLSMVLVEHQLFIAFSSDEYERLALRFKISTNSSLAPLALAAWSLLFFSNTSPNSGSFSFSVSHCLRNVFLCMLLFFTLA